MKHVTQIFTEASALRRDEKSNTKTKICVNKGGNYLTQSNT